MGPQHELSWRKGSEPHDFFIMCVSKGGTGGPDPAEKSQNIGLNSSNTGPDPLKNHSYQASIQCWAIIGRPAKRHLMAFGWWADDGPFIVEFGSSLPSSTKKNLSKVDPLWQNFLDPCMFMLSQQCPVWSRGLSCWLHVHCMSCSTWSFMRQGPNQMFEGF